MASTHVPVTASDLRQAATLSSTTLAPHIDRDWSINAHNMEWSCRRTLDHVLNCLAWYAHDLANEITHDEGIARDGSGDASLAAMIRSVETLAEVLAIVAEAKPPTVRAMHNWGIADPEGFLAMGTIEIVLHTWDIVTALNGNLSDPAAFDALAGRLLGRLFPEAPGGYPAFATLLYVTGRGDLDGMERVTLWQWHSAPLGNQ